MTDTHGARVAPAAPAPQLTEQLTLLMTEDTKAFLLGSLAADNARGEGAVARALIEQAIATFAESNPAEHARRIRTGRRELKRRAAEKA